jgi:hypothetical protein
MKYVTVKCINKQCGVFNMAETIPAGRPVAPHVTEKLGTLTCDMCGHDCWVEPA